jgi:hypothetical protein
LQKEQYRVDVSNRFPSLKNVDDAVDSNRAWESIGDNRKFSAKKGLGHYELKKHEPWFDEGCSELLHQRKQAKLQWL